MSRPAARRRGRGATGVILDDFASFAANRWEPLGRASTARRLLICLRLLFSSRLLGVFLFRFKVWALGQHLPLLPQIADRLAITLFDVNLGNHTRIDGGLYLPHGYVVVDGIVRIGRNCVIAPWVTVGVLDDVAGPTIGDNVFIGTGAKVLGAIRIGDNARIGANAVVLDDVPANVTVAGVPARIVRHHAVT
ncbi:MAG: serine O-acetyltransferase [Dehalococcoidia bacterium]